MDELRRRHVWLSSFFALILPFIGMSWLPILYHINYTFVVDVDDIGQPLARRLDSVIIICPIWWREYDT